MKNYFEMLDKTIKEYFKILSDEIPDFLNEYAKTIWNKCIMWYILY